MNRRSMCCVASGIFALLAGTGSVSLWAEHVILEPGWIAGQASVATEGYKIQSLSVSAYGGGYQSSKTVSQSYTGDITPLDYSLTVQGYDPNETWDYSVNATATARPNPAYCPEGEPYCYQSYTNIYFNRYNPRSCPVAIGETVANDYAANGTIQFNLEITDNSAESMGNIITSWRAWGYAIKNVPPAPHGEVCPPVLEDTNSRSYALSSNTPAGIWNMPVVGNEGVRVYASVTVYGTALRDDGTTYSYSKSYGVHTTSDDLLYVDVGTDDTNKVVTVPLGVEHVAPPAPQIYEYDYGAVEGTVDLNLMVDGTDYSDLLFTYPTGPYSRHYVYGYRSAYIYTNPGDYQLSSERVGTYYYRARSYLYDNDYSQTLYWPYTGGDPTNDRVSVVKDQTSRKDFMNETGILTGQLLFNGSLKTTDLDWYQLRAYGARYYQPPQGWINQPTYGGYSYETVYPDPASDGSNKFYRLFLTPGPWQPYYLRARTNNTDLLGYSGWSDITIYDYNHYYDGSNYDFGQPVDVIGGLSKNKNLNYKIGGVSMCFEAKENSLNLRSPYVYGNAYFYNQDGKREMQVNVSGRSTTPNMPDPEAILYGPEGDYNLTPRAYTEDNTYITFPAREVTLSQQVFKRRCLTSPNMKIDDYVFDLTTDIGTSTATATVTGSATDDDGILRIEFWLDGVRVHVIDYSATAELLLLAQTDVTAGLLPTSVDFSYDFGLTAGLHTIRVTAVDSLGNESYDEWEVAVNTAPVANNDTFETLEDTSLDIAVATLLANDSDADEDTLVLDSFTATPQGELVDNGSGTLTYTPNPDYHGADSFSYTISDGRGGSATATVTINVTSVNDPPLASDDAYSTDEDVVLVLAAETGLLANDSDVEGDALSVSLETAPAHGTVVVSADGAFSYTPDADYHGSDSFTYVVSDGNGGTDTGTVSLTINPVNDAPLASDDGVYSTDEDVALDVAALGLLANDTDVDGDTLTVSLQVAPVHGMVVVSSDGAFSYTPNPNYYGADSFTYVVSDGNGGTDTATVSLTINAVNDLPVASDDAYITDEDVALVLDAPGLLANDTDVDGDVLTASLPSPATLPVHGTVEVNPDGSFSYTPNPDYNGADSFTYVVSDGNGGTATGSVSLTINAVNDPPVVSVDVASQSVQYSDRIATVTISAVDVDSAPSELTAAWTELASMSPSGGCSPSADGSSCSWTLDGQVEVGAGTHTIALTLNDGEFAPSIDTELIVAAEDASVAFEDGNPASVRVATDGGNSGEFALAVDVTETVPDLPSELVAPGDITLAGVSVSLVPVGPGGTIASTFCAADDSVTGVKTVTCSFGDVPVEAYTIEVTIDGGYYTGSAEDVLTVYDPSLGFTTGGGWFYWPGSDDSTDGYPGDKTNFGYTMKYGKKGNNVRGSLLLIRHLPDGQKYRIKSNALDGLAIGQDPTVPYGWASFSGKSTYLEPGMLEPEGNHGFTVYVEDRDEPGSGHDRFWITTRAKDGSAIPAMSLAEPAVGNAVSIMGGNIVAPH